MSGWVPPRLRSLLGASLSEVDLDALGRLVGLAEDTDLEFKSEPWGFSDAERKECAYDIADKANGGGGLIVLGMREDSMSVASGLHAVEGDPDIAERVQQIAAERISPVPTIVHRPVDLGTGKVHLLAVPPTVGAPHGVSVGRGQLRFPVRSGKTRRLLTEPELAEWYRRRFARSGSLEDRLARLHGAGRESVPAKHDGEPWSWLVIAALPDIDGRLAMRRGVEAETRDWVNSVLDDFPSFQSHAVCARPAFRAMRLHDGSSDDDETLLAVGGQLNVDGSGFLACGHPGGRGAVGVPDGLSQLWDEHVISDLFNSCRVLALHASRAGASGDLHIAAEMFTREGPMALGQYRGGRHGQLSGTRQVKSTTGVSSHTTPLDGLAEPGPDLVRLVRILAQDLFSAFGLPEPQQITEELQLVLKRFQAGWHPRIESWAAGAGIEVIQDYEEARRGS